MPGGTATGPWGMGPMTGRAAGYCAGFAVPGFANPVPGRGFGYGPGSVFGRGGGGGRGWRHMYYATGVPGWARAGYYPAWGAAPSVGTPAPEQETAALKAQQEYLTATLDSVKKRIEELEAASAK